MVIIGIDPHKGSHTAVAIDDDELLLGEVTVRSDRNQLERLGRLLAAVEAVRSDGCAALDLCDVACGRFDGYFERGLHAWDSAAGALLVEEAGGRVTSSQGAPHDIFGFDTLATNARLHQALLPFVST